MDETLINRDNNRFPINHNINEFPQRFYNKQIPIILLTMSSNPEEKFERVRLKYERIIAADLFSHDADQFIPKDQS